MEFTPGYTFIDLANVYQCNNCGGYAKTAEEVGHHPTCDRENLRPYYKNDRWYNPKDYKELGERLFK